MNLVAAVPVKSLHLAKSRLRPHVGDRPGLVLFMLEKVLDALEKAHSVHRVAVVSPDRRVLARATRKGCEPLWQEKGDLNQACDLAADWARGAEGLLVVHADLPWLEADDVDAVAALAGDRTSVVVMGADRVGTGTNLLLVRPPQAMAFHFGPGSLEAHGHEARHRGLPALVVRRPGIAHDLDTTGDFQAGPALPPLPDLARFAPARTSTTSRSRPQPRSSPADDGRRRAGR